MLDPHRKPHRRRTQRVGEVLGRGEQMARLTSPTPAEIAALRASYGLTQAQIAKLLHTSVRAYQQWEHGDRDMHPAFWDCLRLKLGFQLN